MVVQGLNELQSPQDCHTEHQSQIQSWGTHPKSAGYRQSAPNSSTKQQLYFGQRDMLDRVMDDLHPPIRNSPDIPSKRVCDISHSDKYIYGNCKKYLYGMSGIETR